MGTLFSPQPEFDVPPGPLACPVGKPLKMRPAVRPSGWAGTDRYLAKS
jgi:hypothetical protein